MPDYRFASGEGEVSLLELFAGRDTLLSKDPPELQRRFANERGWRFRLASHGGGAYIREQTVVDGQDNYPGAVVYKREGDRILRYNACVFGPGDIYCSLWSLLALAGLDAQTFTPRTRRHLHDLLGHAADQCVGKPGSAVRGDNDMVMTSLLGIFSPKMWNREAMQELPRIRRTVRTN